jgi:hypothetical protein
VPASLGPGLRTVSGAVRSLGAKLPPSAIRPMTGKSTNSQKMLLAAAITDGTAVATWASSNGVQERTAYRWAAEPEVRSETESIRRRAPVFVNRSCGRTTMVLLTCTVESSPPLV